MAAVDTVFPSFCVTSMSRVQCYHWRGTIQWWPLEVVKRCRCSNIVSCALHWILRTQDCIQLNDYYCCTHPAVLWIRTRLRSALTTSLPVRRTRLSSVGDRAFSVAAARTWNDLPRHDTSASSLPVLRSRLKTHLFRRSFPYLLFSVCEVTFVIIDTSIVFSTYFLTYLRAV